VATLPKHRWTVPLLATAMAFVSSAMLLGKRHPIPDALETGRGQHATPPDPQAASLGYETEDVSAKLVARVLAGFAGTAVVSIAVLFVMLHFFRTTDTAHRPALTAQQSADVVPPGPRLQRDPYRELHDEQGQEEAKIQGYAWADPDHKLARIPIERAMALVAGRSLKPSP